MEEEKDNKVEEPRKKKGVPKGKKTLLITTIAVLSGLSVAAVAAAKEGYDYAFRRYERPDYEITSGAYCISRYDALCREEVGFLSDGVRLQGYYYPCESAKGLVVVCHGIHAGADDYLPICEYLVKSGYAVFSFDYKGTYDSEGNSTVGMCESLVDLDHALDFLEKSPRFSASKLFLIGHSWGGYAAASALALHPSVCALATISAPANGYTLILEKGEQYAGRLGVQGLPELFLNSYQKILFGKYTGYDAVRGINAVDIPVLIAHGEEDKVIDYNLQSIVSRKAELRTQGVEYYTGTGLQGGHDEIWHSDEAVAYCREVDSQFKALKREKASRERVKAFNDTVDHRLYSAVNEQLFERIVRMFDSAR